MNVRNCARCNGNHDDLVFRPLLQPILDDEGKAVWTHWALCPTTGEPILMVEVEG